MAQQPKRMSEAAVREATGRGWEEWLNLLDEKGAAALTHKEIASLLMEEGLLAPGQEWWAQGVTVAYEFARDRRVVGETADVGFQIGAQKTLPVTADALWVFLFSGEGLRLWLGTPVGQFIPEKEFRYETREGIRGEVRTVEPGRKIRLTYQPNGWERPTTLQIYTLASGPKTSLRFHQEGLRDADQRAEMKSIWQAVLGKLDRALKG